MVDMAIDGGEPSSPSKAPAPPSSSASQPPPSPPADAERVTPCGGVLKSVLRKGAEGTEKPPLHSRCLGEEKRESSFFPFPSLSLSSVASRLSLTPTPQPKPPKNNTVHYEGILRISGETFIKSAEEGRGSGEPAVVVAGRGSFFFSSLSQFSLSFFLSSLSFSFSSSLLLAQNKNPPPYKDASLRATGLNMAVLAMSRGEKARIWIEDPKKFGYGERGSFSFPAVPPLAKLIYDVEMVAFDPPEDSDSDDEDSEGEVEEGTGGEGEGESVPADGSGSGEAKPKKKKEKKEKRLPRSVGSLTYEERLEAASRRKLKGNVLLTGGGTAAKKDPQAALSQYQLALSYLDDDFLFQLEGPHLEAASAIARAARLNCAAAKLVLGDARGAAADASEVLRERPRDAKALFRRGAARRALGDARGAADDLRQASRETEGKSDPAVLRELAAAEAEVKAASKAGDEVMRRAFARSVGKKGGLFSEQEGEKGKGEENPSSPPLASDDGDENRAASGSQKATGALPATLVVLLAVAALAAAAAVARWGK